jgi:hypothetical protein
MQQMLVTLPESFQLAMVIVEVVLEECNSCLRGSAEKRRRRRSKGTSRLLQKVMLRAWHLVGRRQERVSAPRLQAAGTHKAQQSEQGRGRQGGAGQMATGYGKVAGRQAEGERALVCLYTARLCCPVTGALANNVG